MDSLDNTLDLDQSSMLSSTKNEESVDHNIESLVETSGNYITSVQSVSQLSSVGPQLSDSDADALDVSSSSSVSTASQLLSSSDTFRNGSSTAAELTAELSNHPMKLAEVTLEAMGEQEPAPTIAEVRDECVPEKDRDTEEILMSLPSSSAEVANGRDLVSPPVVDGLAAGVATDLKPIADEKTAVTPAKEKAQEASVPPIHTGCLLAEKPEVNTSAEEEPVKSSAQKLAACPSNNSTAASLAEVIAPTSPKETLPATTDNVGSLAPAADADKSVTIRVEQKTVDLSTSSHSCSPKKRQFEELFEAAKDVEEEEESKQELSSGELTDVEDNLESAFLLGLGANHVQAETSGGDGLPAKKARILEPTLPSTVQVLISEVSGARVYLVGTAHFSKESCEDVSLTIQAVQPDIVMVELCKQRTNILHLDEETVLQEAQNLTMERSLDIIKQQGAVQGVMYLLLLSMSAHLTKELGMAPGGEFRRAYTEAQKVPGCILHLGDRPIGITLKRALSGLSWWQKLRLGFNILTSKDTITKEDVEKCKQRDLLENMLAEMAGEFPALSRVFVDERDKFLSHSLQVAANSIPLRARGSDSSAPPVVVGIVGIGHVPGILNNWGKVTREDIREIVKIEPPSRTSRAIKLLLKLTFLGGCVYGLYRVTRVPMTRLLLTK